MEKIDPTEYQKRLNLLTEILSGIVEHTGDLKGRCPYKNRFNQCTAGFGCRNKRNSAQQGALPDCASDDKLNYRSAWETGE